MRARSTQLTSMKTKSRTSWTHWCKGLSWASPWRPFGQPAQRKERPRDEEERRQHRAHDVVEVLERLGETGDHDPEAGPAEARDPGDQRHERASPTTDRARTDRDEQRHAAVDAGARRDPERLGGDELLRVDRRREDRVVGALELVLDERPEHGREGAEKRTAVATVPVAMKSRSGGRRSCPRASRTRSRTRASRSSARRSRRTWSSARTTRS